MWPKEVQMWAISDMQNAIDSMKRAQASHRFRAVTLIESVLYIAIALALIIGGLVFYQQADLSERSTSQMRSLGSIVAETRMALDQKQALVNISSTGDPLVLAAWFDDALVSGGSIAATSLDPTSPPNRLGWASPIRHAWGGAVNVFMGRRDGGEPHLLVYMENIPSSVCLRLSSLTASGKSGFVDHVTEIVFQTPTGGGFTTARLPSTVFPLPILPDDLGLPGHCGKFGGRLNVIYWIPVV